jgi:hypothetical protein
MDIMDYLVEAINTSWRPDSGFSHEQWTMFQYDSLLVNILVDNPQLESYYRDYADSLKLL